MGNPVVHFEVMGSDLEHLIEFYRGMFGWDVTVDEKYGYGEVAAGEGGIAGGIGASRDGAGHVTFYVAVADVDEALAAAVSRGGRVVGEKTDVGDIFIGQFADPEGHVIGVLASKDGSHSPGGDFD